jgi:hypothetical protein
MNYKKFHELITELVAIKKASDNLNDAFKKFEPDFSGICFGRYEDIVMACLKEATGDTADWISYWVYELECGTKAKKESVKYKGKSLPSKTIKDLWNLIKIK